MKKEEEEELPLQSLSTANYKRFTMKLMYIKYMKNGKYKQWHLVHNTLIIEKSPYSWFMTQDWGR